MARSLAVFHFFFLIVRVTGQDCPENRPFQCRTSPDPDPMCLPSTWTCDGERDCWDGSDEEAQLCPPRTCSASEFMCKNKWCIPADWKCNRVDDCGDGSDELCMTTCTSNQRRCADGSGCYPISWRCDGDEDCRDGSDETQCGSVCKEGLMRCETSSGPICFQPTARCDGVQDCADGTDERGCATVPPNCDPVLEFDCQDDGRECIPMFEVCNGLIDCRGEQDEADDLCLPNLCLDGNHGCEHLCLYNRISGKQCACRAGYRLANDTKSCLDIDECALGTICSQSCTNTRGAYECSCLDGYIPLPNDPGSCKAAEGEAILFVANNKDIREFRLKDQEMLPLIDSQTTAIGIDFDYAKKIIYWSEITHKKILSVQLTDPQRPITATPQTVLDEPLDTPDGIALDWVHGNIYWTDAGRNVIGVMNLDTRLLKDLVREDLDEPRAIAIDPRDNYGPYMYWTDWGVSPRIEKAGLDGSRRKKLVTTDIGWPNGLAIDFTQNRIYWIDSRLKMVASVDLDGNSRRTVAEVHPDHHTFSLALFEDTIYYTEWRSTAIYKMNKRNLSEIVQVSGELGHPNGLCIFHSLRQPNATNRCGDGSGRCSDSMMCLPSPVWPGYTCECPDNPPDPNQPCVPGVDVTTVIDDSTTEDEDTTVDDLTTPVPEYYNATTDDSHGDGEMLRAVWYKTLLTLIVSLFLRF